MDRRPLTAALFSLTAVACAFPDLGALRPKQKDPWAGKTYGRQHVKGDTTAYQRTSPRYRATRHGCMKKVRSR